MLLNLVELFFEYIQFDSVKEEKEEQSDDNIFEPGYLYLHRTGELKERGEKLWKVMENCRLCPRRCGANRLKGEKGFCGSGSRLEIAAFHPHFGEEKPLVGKNGSGTETYPEVTKKALLEMHRQVGVARPAGDGLMRRGLMIRHLVMPNNVSGTKEVVEWIAGNLPKDTYLNLMSQYTPVYKAGDYPEISRRITREEYTEAISHAKAAELTSLEIQGYFRF
jgi:putative pyruvate formate lyase activating enzyme